MKWRYTGHRSQPALKSSSQGRSCALLRCGAPPNNGGAPGRRRATLRKCMGVCYRCPRSPDTRPQFVPRARSIGVDVTRPMARGDGWQQTLLVHRYRGRTQATLPACAKARPCAHALASSPHICDRQHNKATWPSNKSSTANVHTARLELSS